MGPGPGDDWLEEVFSRAPDTMPEQRTLAKQQMQQQTSEQRAEGEETAEGGESESHQRGFSRIASADSNRPSTRTGSAFSMVKNGGFERMRSSGSDSKLETVVCILSIASM